MINVQCVYGNRHATHLESCLIPNLAGAAGEKINFLCMNYERGPVIADFDSDKLAIRNIAPPKEGPCGFAENHNHIFNSFPATASFVLMNPDCIPQPGSIDALLRRKGPETAIVEGRQWPFEHPKEYCPLTHATPWASFAFCLVDSEFYRQEKGMDELYFLYDEDVDLSWRAWLGGWNVLYEPKAHIVHFTDGYFARDDKVSDEQFFSLRNFILISRKFFGQAGEERAINLLRKRVDPGLFAAIEKDYRERIQPRVAPGYDGRGHSQIKILDINTFARTRSGL